MALESVHSHAITMRSVRLENIIDGWHHGLVISTWVNMTAG